MIHNECLADLTDIGRDRGSGTDEPKNSHLVFSGHERRCSSQQLASHHTLNMKEVKRRQRKKRIGQAREGKKQIGTEQDKGGEGQKNKKREGRDEIKYYNSDSI